VEWEMERERWIESEKRDREMEKERLIANKY
jgi:hypothetical protein